MIYLTSCIFFIFLQGFFASAEISFISSSLLKLRHRENRGNKAAAKVYQLLLKPEKFLATILVGTNLSVILSTSILTFFLIKLGIAKSNLWITFLFTPLVVIFAEMIPKNIGRYFREEYSCFVVDAITVFEKIFAPLTGFIEKASKRLIKIVIGNVKVHSPFVTKEELKLLIKEVEKTGAIDRGEKKAIEEVFEFRQNKVKDICVGIKKLASINFADSYEGILKTIRESGFTRYPVFKNKEIAGYVNIYDLLYSPRQDWQALIRPITKVGFNQKVYEAFRTLKAKKESIALAIKGKKIYGIITLEDSMQEIISSIIKQ